MPETFLRREGNNVRGSLVSWCMWLAAVGLSFSLISSVSVFPPWCESKAYYYHHHRPDHGHLFFLSTHHQSRIPGAARRLETTWVGQECKVLYRVGQGIIRIQSGRVGWFPFMRVQGARCGTRRGSYW